jgi:hypothetical protein
MKILSILLIAACQSIAVMAQESVGSIPYSTKYLADDSIHDVIVNTSAGDVLVTGQKGQTPRIETYITDNYGNQLSKEEIQKRLDHDFDMQIAVKGRQLNVAVNYLQHNMDWKKGLKISFKIYVSQDVSTDLKAQGGDISLYNLKGNEIFTSSGGNLQIDQLGGFIIGKTSGANIKVLNSSDNIDLKTSGGDIIAKNCTGRIRLVTSAGNLVLQDVNGNIITQASGGTIEGNY